MYYQNQNQIQTQGPQLRYDPNTMAHQMLNLSVSNPPLMPNVQGDPQILNSLRYISGGLAMEIQGKANQNSLRRTMFNICAENMFQNESFAQLIAATVDYVTLLFYRHNQGPVERCVDIAIPEMVALACAVNVRLYPELMQRIPPELVREVQNDINKFDALSNEIRMFMQNPQQPQYQQYQQQPQQYQQYQPQQQPYQQQQFASSVDPRFGGNSNAGNSVFTNGGGNSAFGNGSSGNNAATGQGKFKRPGGFTNQNMTPRKETEMNQDQKNNYMGQQNQQAPQQQQAPVQTAGVEVPLVNAKWEPTERFPYYVVHSPRTQELFCKTNADGTTEPVLRKRNPDAMNYDLHAIPTAFGKPPQALDLSDTARALSRIQYGVQEINKAAKGPVPVVEGEEVVPVKPYIAVKRLLETSLEGAWLQANLDRLQIIDRPHVYRAYGTVVEPIITEVDESDAVKMLSQMATYVMAEQYINAGYDTNNEELSGMFNLRLTAEVNRSIRQELGLPGIYIDSFREDIGDLLEALEEIGPDIKAAFLSRQKQHILAACRPLDVECAAAVTASFMDGREFPENAKPVITYMSTNYSLTYLACTQWELDVEVSAVGLGSAVTENLTPVLYALVAGIFEDAKNQAPVDRYLVKTADGRVLEVTKAALGHDPLILVSLIK